MLAPAAENQPIWRQWMKHRSSPALAWRWPIGLLLGLERGWHEREQSDGARTARNSHLRADGASGRVAAWLSALTSPVVLAVGLAALGRPAGPSATGCR